MSPTSQQRRKQRQKLRHDDNQRRLRKYEHTEIPLDEEQHSEMTQIVNEIEEHLPNELEKLIAEGHEHGVASHLKEVWSTDRRKESCSFQSEQLKNRTGKRSNRWSVVTIRMALAVFTRSPAAYESLKSFNILQLPSRSTLQAYTGAFLHSSGANSACIADQVAQFILFCEQNKKEGKKDSQKDGVLIFDEVKVVSRLMWNSRSQSLIGLAMDHHDMCSLADVYQFLESDQASQTSYILQFLWRDLTSKFDIVGPYFPYSKSMESKFLLPCIFETLKLFHLHGLKTSLLVCDGASTNLSTLKATHGHYGVYPINTGKNDPYEIFPWMVNPYNPPCLLYWLICPSYQTWNEGI